MQEAGLSREVVRGGAAGRPQGVAEALAARFGGDWSGLRQWLEEARAAKSEAVSPGDALTLVRGMAVEEERLRAMLAAGAGRGEARLMNDPLVEFSPVFNTGVSPLRPQERGLRSR